MEYGVDLMRVEQLERLAVAMVVAAYGVLHGDRGVSPETAPDRVRTLLVIGAHVGQPFAHTADRGRREKIDRG